MSDAKGWPRCVRWLECLSLASIAAVFAYAPLLLLALGLAILTITLHAAIRIHGGHPGSNAVVFVLAAFLVVVGVLSIAGLSRTRRPEPARRAKCASNLKQISYACHLYATDNSEKLPQNLGGLFPKYVSDATVFRSPAVQHRFEAYAGAKVSWIPDKHVTYCYVYGLEATDPPGYVLAFDEEWNHDGRGIHVLHMGINVEWVTDIKRFHEELRRQAEELKAQGRSMRIIRPSWSRWPERPE